jgi:putative 4-mercaptohistidine N1-methyltranferase
LGFPVRCVTECLLTEQVPQPARALDLGCAVGRSSFELARFCTEVVGIDYSRAFIHAAGRLQQHGAVEFDCIEEGDLTRRLRAQVPDDIDPRRVAFQQGDAQAFPAGIGTFDVMLMANLIDRLPNPCRCLEQLPALIRPGGQLILTSPYTWLTEYTPKENWLGGYEQEGQPVRTLQTLQRLLQPDFKRVARCNLPFLIREHARKFQWSVAEATVWVRH